MTAGAVLPDAPDDIADRLLFAVDGIEFTVADVAPRVRLGDRELPERRDDPAATQEAFRRSRGLLTADQLTRWLADWSVTPEEFVAWSEPAEVSRWVEIVCSGLLERTATELAAAAAAACELGEPPTSAAGFDPTGWTERLVAHAVTPTALGSAVAAHRLGWTTVRGAGVFARSRGVAEELRHWMVQDGLDLGIAAAQAGCPTYEVDGVVDDLGPAALRARIVGALPGEVIGPVEAGAGWTLLRLDSRSEPDLSEAAVLERARARVRTDVLERAVLRHVSRGLR